MAGINYELAYMTRPEVEEAVKKIKTVILPFGATEQHGPHLPLGTDTFLARGLAQKLAERIEALVLPEIPVGYSYVWKGIPGTVSIHQETVKILVKDVAKSLHEYGIERLIILNTHGANSSALKYAARELAGEISMEIFYFTYPALDEVAKIAESPRWHGMVHACEIETSWLLALHPELCDMEKAVAEYPEGSEVSKYHYSSLPMGVLSKSGVFGDATLATKEKGEVMLEKIIEHMEKVIRGEKM